MLHLEANLFLSCFYRKPFHCLTPFTLRFLKKAFASPTKPTDENETIGMKKITTTIAIRGPNSIADLSTSDPHAIGKRTPRGIINFSNNNSTNNSQPLIANKSRNEYRHQTVDGSHDYRIRRNQ